MGKSETLKMFARLGYPVFDADMAVHRLYEKNGAAVPKIEQLYPDVVVDGAIDRDLLARQVLKDPNALRKLEDIVHPLVRALQADFLKTHQESGSEIVILDIPLLFETGREQEFDAIVVTSTTPEIQHKRALERPGMTEQKLDQILSRQMPDKEKRKRADFIVDTGVGLEAAFDQVRRIVDTLNNGPGADAEH